MIHVIYIGLIILICIGFSTRIRIIERKSFITGSTAFGYRTKKSDTDMVLYLSQEDINKLEQYHSSKMIFNGYGACRLQCENIDFILVSDIDAYNAWASKTKELTELSKTKQLTRPEVIKSFKQAKIGYK